MPVLLGRLAALALLIALAACSVGGADTEQDMTPTEADGSTSSPEVSTPAALELLSDRVIEDPLPDPQGTVEVLGRAVYTAAEKRQLSQDTDGFAESDIAVTDDLIVVAPATRMVTAMDRDTGEVAWTSRPPGLDGETVCRIVHPHPDAEVVVLVTAGTSTCERFTRLDLRTGEVKGTTLLEFGDLASTGLVSGVATIGPYTFVGLDTLDRSGISVLDVKGRLRQVADDVDLGMDLGEDLVSVMALPGSDVLVAELSSEEGIDTGRETGETERYVGLRVLADGSLERIWDVGGVEVRESLRPRARLVQNYAGVTLFERETPEGVLWRTTFRRGGREVPRLSAMDPETGLLSSSLVLDGGRQGVPQWLAVQFFSRDTLVDGDEVFSLSASEDLLSLVRYDLGAGEVSWAWKPRIPHDYGPVLADLIGLTSDGEYVYASGNAGLDTLVVKLDRDTGEIVATWRFDDRFDSTFDRARMWLVDDLLVWVPKGAGGVEERDYVAVTRLG